MENLRPSVLEEVIEKKTSVRLSGHVYDIDVKNNYQVLYLKNNSIIYQNESFKESRIIVYDEGKLNIEIGNQINVTGELSFYEVERNPGNFNQKFYYQKQGICAYVWAYKVNITDGYVNKLRNSLYYFRTQWKTMLVDILGEEEGAILSAMLLAEKAGMNEETKELYQANGIGHILAISGLHLSVIGVGLYKILRRISGSFMAGGIAGISFLVLYTLMIGMSVSVLRAFIMFLFRVGADITGRHYDIPTALGFSALITIIWKPLCLYDGGFWLSYGAIAAIILVLPIFINLPFQGFWASVGINLVTLPILLYYFYEVPLYAVFLNMIVVPLMTVVLLCGISGSLCSAIFVADGVFGVEGIGGVLLKICGGIFSIYEKSCTLFLGLPGARIVAGQPEMWQIGVYYGLLLVVIGVWWHYKSMTENRKITLFVILVVNIGIIIFPFDETICRLKGEMSITMLDVGQGDGIYIRGPEGNTFLIDGGSSDVKRAGQYRIEPFLKSQGVRKIDYVFVSHGDGDHINGIAEIIERQNISVAIETIILPDKKGWDASLIELACLAKENGVRVVEMREGQTLVEGEMSLTCLAPVSEGNVYKGNSNAGSMVLALNYGEFDALFTGDVEAEGEQILTKVIKNDYQNVKWDILKVAHHGSKNSSGDEFLQSVLPSYSIISAARENSYGHPHEETLERLLNAESTILSTQGNGAITIVTDGKKMHVEGYVRE